MWLCILSVACSTDKVQIYFPCKTAIPPKIYIPKTRDLDNFGHLNNSACRARCTLGSNQFESLWLRYKGLNADLAKMWTYHGNANWRSIKRITPKLAKMCCNRHNNEISQIQSCSQMRLVWQYYIIFAVDFTIYFYNANKLLHMCLQIACLGRGIVTLVTFICIFSMVCFQMSLQVAYIRGCRITLVALFLFVSTVCF